MLLSPGPGVPLQGESSKAIRSYELKLNPVSGERARSLLEANPDHFASEPDEESKLRKLQTCVEMIVAARHEFRVTDPSRARRIIATG